MQAKIGMKPCVDVNFGTPTSSSSLLDYLATHDWEVTSCQDSQIMGMVIALRCSRCNLEWSNIISKGNIVVVP
jgi:hypothetical protein